MTILESQLAACVAPQPGVVDGPTGSNSKPPRAGKIDYKRLADLAAKYEAEEPFYRDCWTRPKIKIITMSGDDKGNIKPGSGVRGRDPVAVVSDRGERFDCIGDAARATGAAKQSICRCLKGTVKTAAGRRWSVAPKVGAA